MTNKEEYKQLCESDSYIPIFSQYWWMDAVCGEDKWDVILAKKGEEIIGSLVYCIKHKYGFKSIVQPPLTQNNGVLIQYPVGIKDAKKISYEKEVVNTIDKELKKIGIDYFNQNFHHSFIDWSPFFWKGYDETTTYTYILESTNTLEDISDNLSKSTRKYIRQNLDSEIRRTDNIKAFYELNRKVFKRQGLSIPYSYDFIEKLDKACKEKKSRVIWEVDDDKGNLNCMLYLVYDTHSAYLLMSGTDPENRDPNLKTSLVWEAIKFSIEKGLNFDFEGSMIEGVAKFNANFGAKRFRYFRIEKPFSKKGKLYKTISVLKNQLRK
jgi:lipid II:glycine glycyltransferase (peptidoglycan interpeptide bridge formation enzyme)